MHACAFTVNLLTLLTIPMFTMSARELALRFLEEEAGRILPKGTFLTTPVSRASSGARGREVFEPVQLSNGQTILHPTSRRTPAPGDEPWTALTRESH